MRTRTRAVRASRGLRVLTIIMIVLFGGLTALLIYAYHSDGSRSVVSLQGDGLTRLAILINIAFTVAEVFRNESSTWSE